MYKSIASEFDLLLEKWRYGLSANGNADKICHLLMSPTLN